METQNLISVQLICNQYNVPISFINTLQEFQLVELIDEDNNLYIHTKHMNKVEKMIRLHYDLDINIEGVDVIYNLLKKVESLKQEINVLNNRLRLYEDL
ncbi:chaperone modulator CbpM [Mariniflexile gromovii]|uniref:Chaperone modulator CbpM n=1 Tax=Mariniflexile gromovii TaxID=362523 RepID=A0ABS4BQT1_9FLAO|nr:chaperone modulator CbpM [Mariniflexile gromovii]MBP0902946.1 chaperone modulator CbpM [Mariniflexile gromovii]